MKRATSSSKEPLVCLFVCLTFYHTIPTFDDPKEEVSYKTLLEKEEMLVTNIFSFSPQCLLPIPKRISVFNFHFFLSSANAFNLEKPENLSFGKKLKKILL